MDFHSNIVTLAEEMLLLENRLDFLKTNFAGKLDTSHDLAAKDKSHTDIVDHFAQHADPTANKSHTQWILKQYQNKKIRMEDHPRIHQALSDFNSVKQHLEKKDINQYPDLPTLEQATHPHIQAKSEAPAKLETKGKDRRDPDTYDENHIKKIYHDKSTGVKAYHLKTEEASQKCYGGGHTSPGGTSWCTAASAFNTYANKGRLITMHFPNGRKLQMHHNSDQIMNEKDERVSKDDPGYKPYLKNIEEVVNKTAGKNVGSLKAEFGSYTDEEKKKVIQSTPEVAAKHLKLNDEEFNQLSAPTIKRRYDHIKNDYVDHEDTPTHLDYLSRNRNLSKEQHEKVYELAKKHESLPSKRGLLSNGHKEVADKIAKTDSSIGPTSLIQDYGNRSDLNDHERNGIISRIHKDEPDTRAHIPPQFFSRYKTEEGVRQAYNVLGSHPSTKENIGSLISHATNVPKDVMHHALENDGHIASNSANVDHEYISKAIKNIGDTGKGLEHASTLAKRKDLNSEHAKSLMSLAQKHMSSNPSTTKNILNGLSENKAANPDHVAKAYGITKEYDYEHKITHRHDLSVGARKEYHDTILKQTNVDHAKSQYASNAKITNDHVSDLIKAGYGSQALRNPHLKANHETIGHFAKSDNILDVKEALDHPLAQTSHFEHIHENKPELHGMLAGMKKTPKHVLENIRDKYKESMPTWHSRAVETLNSIGGGK